MATGNEGLHSSVENLGSETIEQSVVQNHMISHETNDAISDEDLSPPEELLIAYQNDDIRLTAEASSFWKKARVIELNESRKLRLMLAKECEIFRNLIKEGFNSINHTLSKSGTFARGSGAKLSLPTLGTSDDAKLQAHQWMSKCEDYFTQCKVTSIADRISQIHTALPSSEYSWFMSWRENKNHDYEKTTWEEVKQELLEHIHPHNFVSQLL